MFRPKTHAYIFLINMVAAILFVSCESSEPKQKDDFEVYKQEKISSADSDSINKEAEYLQLKNDAATATVSLDAWTVFRNSIERKIAANTSKIKSIRAKQGATSKMLSKASRLEKDNADLQTRLNDFKKETDERLTNFSKEIQSDADAISTELTDLSKTK